MLHLALRMVGHRISALLAVACALLGGAALITGTGVLAESGLRSHLPPGRLAGADLVVSADQNAHPSEDLPIPLPERGTVPAELTGRLAGLPGVTTAVGDLSFPAALLDTTGRILPTGEPETAGHGWSSTALLDSPRIEGTPPAGPGEIALDRATAQAAGLRPGDRVQVLAAGRPAAEYRLTAVLHAPGPGLYFADGTAAELAGRTEGPKAGTVDLIALRVEPDATEAVAGAVRAELRGTGLVAATGAERGDLASPGAAAARSLLVLLAGSLSGVVLLITGFVTASALAVSLAGQRRDLALMRAVGATPRQIRRLAATQAAVIGAVAAVPGIALGYLLAGRFRDQLAQRGVIPEELPLTLSPLPALATVLLLTLAVQLAARGAAWRLARLPATEAVAESRSEPRTPSRARTLAGLLLILGGTTLSVVPLLSRTPLAAAGTSLAGIIGAIGLGLAGPALIRAAGEALARRLRPGISAPAWLAVANLRGYALRLAGIVTTLAMAVAFVLTYTFAQTTVLSATATDLREGTLAQQRISAPALGGLPTDTLAAVRDTPGVRAAAPVGETTVLWTHRQFGEEEQESAPALILTPEAPGVLDLGVTEGDLTELTGATVAVSSEAARSGAGLGQELSLVLGDGTPVQARVVAVYSRGLGFGPVVLSHDLAAGHTTTGLDQSILVRTEDTEAARQALAELVAARPGLAAEPATPGGQGLADAPPELWVNLAALVVLLGYLLLNIANKIVATTAQRRGEIAALRLIGTTPRQIRAMMRREALLVAGAALLAGCLLSAIPLALLGQGFLHRPWPAGPVWLLPALAALLAAVSFATTELPTRRALRTPPTQALAHRE